MERRSSIKPAPSLAPAALHPTTPTHLCLTRGRARRLPTLGKDRKEKDSPPRAKRRFRRDRKQFQKLKIGGWTTTGHGKFLSAHFTGRLYNQPHYCWRAVSLLSDGWFLCCVAARVLVATKHLGQQKVVGNSRDHESAHPCEAGGEFRTLDQSGIDWH